eukprot:4895140-Alexandrium_andersonii.AAC.1
MALSAAAGRSMALSGTPPASASAEIRRPDEGEDARAPGASRQSAWPPSARLAEVGRVPEAWRRRAAKFLRGCWGSARRQGAPWAGPLPRSCAEVGCGLGPR